MDETIKGSQLLSIVTLIQEISIDEYCDLEICNLICLTYVVHCTLLVIGGNHGTCLDIGTSALVYN